MERIAKLIPAIIHIGIAKTGTTFLQTWLESSAYSLERYGLSTVSSLCSRRLAVECIVDPPANSVDPLASSRDDILSVKDAQSFVKCIEEVEYRKQLLEQLHLILSSELFSISAYNILVNFSIYFDYNANSKFYSFYIPNRLTTSHLIFAHIWQKNIRT